VSVDFPPPQEAKQQARTRLRAALADIDPDLAAQNSEAISRRIEAEPAFVNARALLLFVPMVARSEVDLRPLVRRALASGKRVALPRAEWANRTLAAHLVSDIDTDLEPDPARPGLGLMQPRASCRVINPEDLDLLLVPGLGFDERGNRIGHGAGFYDRFLARPGVRGTVIGIGFDVQVLSPASTLPCEAHDRRLDALATETRFLWFTRGADVDRVVGPADPD